VSVTVFYASRYGSTAEVARIIADRLTGNVDVVSLAGTESIDPESTDAIVIGTPVFAGRMPRVVRRFIDRNRHALTRLPVVLFVTCLYTGDRAAAQLADNVPGWLVAHATPAHYVGGRVRLDQLRWLDRVVLQRSGVLSGDVDTISREAIEKVVEDVTRSALK
jgi:menaquinone-dependent protoporphyrinogen oxidase